MKQIKLEEKIMETQDLEELLDFQLIRKNIK